MNYFLQLAFLLVMTLTFSCQGDKTEAQKFDSTNKNVVVKTTNDRVLGVARIEPKEGIINLVAGASGKILDVMIENNMTIQKGQTLLLLDQSVENSQLQQAKSKITPQKVAVSAQKANVETARTRLKNAREVMKRNQELYAGNAITKQALDDSRYLVEQLEKELSAAESLVTQANSRISELETDITYYETLLNQKKVKATQNGKILKVSVKRGEYAQNDKVIAEFAPEGPLVAKTEIDEIYAERIKTGQKAIILSQTSGDTLARGTVFFAADYLKAKSLFKDQSTELEDRRIREVHIKIEEGQKPLIGSRVDCIILLN
ncbi:MAG: HlyD family efflux transporter periplasmic adaptor subunit [Saprospiraceae bacterium]|nr:HlyD family efflux transporter periplasmic adaptor subunit [Saprospiraceae bacterium]